MLLIVDQVLEMESDIGVLVEIGVAAKFDVVVVVAVEAILVEEGAIDFSEAAAMNYITKNIASSKCHP